MTFSVENFTLHLRESDTPHPNLIIYTGLNSALNVRGDFLFSDTRSSTNWYQTRLTFNGNGNVAIDGNFTVDSRAVNAAEGLYNCVIFSVNSANFTVGKILTLKNSNGDENIFRTSPTSAGTFTRTLGGLQITQRGMIQLAGNASAVNTTELIFTNSGTSEYIGGLLTRDSDGELANNKLNVRMTANDAANGRQIMRFNTTSGWTLDSYVYSDAANALNEVEVSSGRLDLGMYGGMKGGSLMIMGYNRPSEAVFSATGTAADTEIGSVTFDTMSFYRGTVVFDLAEGDGDFIQVDGAMTKVTGASPLVLELNVSAYDLQAWIEASERDEWSADLLSFATEGSNVSADDFSVKLQDGIIGKIMISELNGISAVSANLSPHPRTLRNRRHARACRARLRRAQKTGKINICFNKKPGKTEFPRLFCASKTAAFKGGERPINRRDSLYARNADFQTPSSASPSASGARRKAVFYRRLPPNGKRPARFALTKSAAAEHAKPSISAHSAGSGTETIQ